MKLTHAEIAALCRGLSRLLHGGLSLNEGAFLLAEGEQGALKALLTAMGEAMDSGSDLHEAMVSNGGYLFTQSILFKLFTQDCICFTQRFQTISCDCS